jgi:hypothetical protein
MKTEIKKLYETNKERYQELLSDIETRLKWWTTTLELAKTFEDKVSEYKKEWDKWSSIFLVIGLLILIYFMITTWIKGDASSFGQAWIHILDKSPVIWFAIWIISYVSNRRAETKKLEESYKHKETLARSYVWYRKSIEELSGEDTDLLKSHMNNLLQAINKDSSDFLMAKWENHPFLWLFRWFNSISDSSKVWQ